ncbi:hypothetical protein ACFL6I_13390 [candidate division KSB1 bacterium]
MNPFTSVLCQQTSYTPPPSTGGGGGTGVTGTGTETPSLTGPGSGADSYELTSVPFNQFCSNVKGDNWRNVDDKFCGGSSPTGYSCCGLFNPTSGSGGTLSTQAFDSGNTQGISTYTVQCQAQGGTITAQCVSYGSGTYSDVPTEGWFFKLSGGEEQGPFTGLSKCTFASNGSRCYHQDTPQELLGTETCERSEFSCSY